MEFSKLKLEIYDLLGTLVPGLLALTLAVITFSGWHAAVGLAGRMTGTVFTMILLLAFAAGQIVQEAADKLVKTIRGERFFKQPRDRYWKSPASAAVRQKINTESGIQLDTVDDAFDYCLTRIGDRFAKRDTFMAISDLARCLWLLSILGLIPLIHGAADILDMHTRIYFIGEGVLALVTFSYLAWIRMLRFRELSDLPVFRSFLALNASSDTGDPTDLATKPD
jgi:hypothetical protein